MDSKEIALFPIPGMACFPGTVVPLHVFEPRYRDMLKESVKLGRWIGVCHTKKVLTEAKTGQTKAEALNSNQGNFEPQDIFSAGPATIEDVTADGRLIVSIEMMERFERTEEIQSLPYRIVKAKSYEDDTDILPSESINLLRKSISAFLESRFDEMKEAEVLKQSLNKLNQLDNASFSFQVFQWIRPDGAIAQKFLEMKNPNARLLGLSHLLGITDSDLFKA